jgi:hypothetical protein
MRLGKRQKDGDPAADEAVVAAPEPAPEATSGSAPEAAAPGYGQPVVNGEAVEIPAERPVFPAMPPAAAFEPPLAFASAPGPTAMPFPAAGEPVAVVAPGQQPQPVTPLGAAAETFASGHGPVPAPAWPEGVQEIAAQRPEAVVGAAFVGGILAALILRRLGN